MKTIVSYILGLLMIIGLPCASQAQGDVHITGGKSIVSEAVHDNWYIGENAVLVILGDLYFYGRRFVIDPSATILGPGTIHFMNPQTGVLGTNITQQFDGGNNTIGARVRINNPNNIVLGDYPIPGKALDDLCHAHFGNEFIFGVDDGHMFVDNHRVLFRAAASARPTGYDENRYFITTGVGVVAKEDLTGTFVFPIGVSEDNVGNTDYTPAALTNTGDADVFDVSVFDNVYYDGFSGTQINENTVSKTWVVFEGTPGGSNVTMDLQHNRLTEGGGFDNTQSYIARYVGIEDNTVGGDLSASKWDFVGVPNCSSGTTMGTLTDGVPMNDASILSRSGLDDFANYFLYTKALCRFNALPVELTSFSAIEVGCEVVLNWTTASEENNEMFVIEKSLDGIHFDAIGVIQGNGTTNELSTYQFLDEEPRPLNYYRLQQVDFDGSMDYSEVITVESDCHFNGASHVAEIYPNPIQNVLNLNLVSQDKTGEVKIILTDNLGRIIYDEILDHDGYTFHAFDLSQYPPGMYYLHVNGAGWKDESFKVVKTDEF